MANILSRTTGENIPALPVHDSVFVRPSIAFVRQVMVEEYQRSWASSL